MRAGAYTVQQTLTAEAASVLKHSLTLARRRGHAQVTPLHVAATLLTSRSTNLLRRACLNSQQSNNSSSIPTTNNNNTTSSLHHPLQCRALELCFNVALNRLPTTPAGPLLHGQATLSNALIAALKRAQAHQRRGCIENQNQNQHQQQSSPLLSIKVELEQLVISILDDPSVSRVMREAGFSSTAVKNSIDQDSTSSTSSVFQCYASSSAGGGGGGVFSLPSSPSHHHNYHSFWQSHLLNFSSPYPIPGHVPLFPSQKKVDTDDVKLVMEVMLGKKRKNVVIVGDSLSLTDGLVVELTRRLEKGDEVPEELKGTHIIKFQFAPIVLKYMKKDDVAMNLLELKKKVDSVCSGGSGGGVIIYTGDLKWTLDTEKEPEKGESVTSYSPANHLVSELGRLLSDYGSVGCSFSRSSSNNNGVSSSFNNVWLIGTASYQTYMKCQMKQPPLDLQWSLQAVSVPSGGLGLSLQAPSVHDSGLLETKPVPEEEHPDGLACCAECKSNYEKEAEMFKSGSAQHKHLPSWLQQHATDAPSKDQLAELRKKWNRLCHGLHKDRNIQNHWNSTVLGNQIPIGKTYPYNSSCTWWPANSSFFPDASSISFSSSPLKTNSVPRFRRQNSCTIEFNGNSAWAEKQCRMELEPNLDVLKNMNSEGKEVKITLSLGNSLFADSGKLAEQNIERMLQRGSMRRLMQDNVPWQSESISAIVEALVNSKCTNKDTWMLIQGNDSIGKRRLAHAIAESIFVSADSVLHLNMRMRGNKQISFSEMLTRASRNQEKLIVLVENVDLADNEFLRLLAERFENGKFAESSRAEKNSGQIIFLLTKGDSIFVDYQDEKNPRSVIQMALKVSEIATAASGFGNHKRRADWGLSKPSKNRRIGETEDSSLGTVENETAKREVSWQSSFNTLDLNVKAVDDENETDEKADLSPISSDLTRESGGSDVQTFPITFLESIENRYTFNRSLTRDREMTELFMSKIKGSFDEVYGGGVNNKVKFSFGDGILEEVLGGAGFFTNSLFEKWLKDIFQTSLMKIVKFSGRDGIGLSVRLCSIGKEGEEEDVEEVKMAGDGFMKTCLPKEIHVSLEN